jgi:hypothetical protein
VRRVSVHLPAEELPGGIVVGGFSRFGDAWARSQTTFLAPRFSYPPTRLEFILDEPAANESAPASFGSLFGKSIPVPELPADAIVFDCRHDSSTNVAHILQGQIGVALAGLEALGMTSRVDDLVFLTKAGIPDYCRSLFNAFGFQVVSNTAWKPARPSLRMAPKKFTRRWHACSYVRKRAIERGLVGVKQSGTRRICLARRHRRTITNFASDILPVLSNSGFDIIYAEDHSIPDQIATIVGAESIVGMHGAAMGFMMLRDPQRHGVVAETFPCGYPTNWARAICHAAGDTWIGAQGDLEEKPVRGLLQSVHPRTFEGNDYRLDPDAIASVLAIMQYALDSPPLQDVSMRRLQDFVTPASPP